MKHGPEPSSKLTTSSICAKAFEFLPNTHKDGGMSEESGWQSESSCSSENGIGYEVHEQDTLGSPRLRREVQGIKESLLRSIQECNERFMPHIFPAVHKLICLRFNSSS